MFSEVIARQLKEAKSKADRKVLRSLLNSQLLREGSAHVVRDVAPDGTTKIRIHRDKKPVEHVRMTAPVPLEHYSEQQGTLVGRL